MNTDFVIKQEHLLTKTIFQCPTEASGDLHYGRSRDYERG